MKTTSFRGFAALCTLVLAGSALGQTTENFTVTPTSPGVFDENNIVGVPGDAAPDFPTSSVASDGEGKTDAYFTPETLFDGRTVEVGEVASISYWTKTGTTHTVEPGDWSLIIYTKPYDGDVSSGTWYGDRYGAEPYLSSNLNDPANTWNLWSTDGATNQLRFYESTDGAPGANFGSFTDPAWDTFISQNALSGQPRADQEILYFSWHTGSAWADGFTGQLDGVTITLTDGSVARINFEADAVPVVDTDGDGVPDEDDHCPNSDIRPNVDVNGDLDGETSVINTVGDDGCTLQDLVNKCSTDAQNHGQYVSCVTHLANELKAAGLITGKQKSEMTKGAAQANSGKGASQSNGGRDAAKSKGKKK